MHREILQIYRKASDQTRAVYELGHSTDGVEEENWIVRWLLWHAFRYRDQRNNRRPRAGSQVAVSEDEDEVSSNADTHGTPEAPLVAAEGSTLASRLQGGTSELDETEMFSIHMLTVTPSIGGCEALLGSCPRRLAGCLK